MELLLYRAVPEDGVLVASSRKNLFDIWGSQNPR